MYQCFGIIGLAFLFMCVLLGWSIRREQNSRLIFTPFLLFCLNEVVMVWPATVYARYDGVSRDSYATLVIVCSTLAYMGGYFAVRELQGWASTPFRFWSQPLQDTDERAHLLAILFCAALLLPAGLYLYQGLPPAVSGLRQFISSGYESGVAESIASKRLELTKGHYFGGEYRGQGVIRSIMRIGWPYLTAIAFVFYYRRRWLSWRIILLALFTACFVFIAGDGTRGPFLWAMIALLVSASYHANLRLRTCLGFVTILFGALVMLSLTQKMSGAAERGTLWSEGLQQLFERIFVGNAIHSVNAIEFVRSGDLDLRWGSIHANDIGASLPFVGSDIPFSYELFLLETPDAKATRTTFSNTTYIGILYAEFGLPGCLLGYLALGALTAWFTRKLLRRKKTAMTIVFTGISSMYVGQIGLWGGIYAIVSLLVLFCFDILYHFGWSHSLATRRRKGNLPSTAPSMKQIVVQRHC